MLSFASKLLIAAAAVMLRDVEGLSAAINLHDLYPGEFSAPGHINEPGLTSPNVFAQISQEDHSCNFAHERLAWELPPVDEIIQNGEFFIDESFEEGLALDYITDPNI